MASYSPFYGDNYSLLVNKSNNNAKIKRLFRRRQALVTGELAKELTGAAVGANTATLQYKRVDGNGGVTGVGQLGGARTIVTRTQINRVTAAGDETAVDKIVQPTGFKPASYPVDKSGNGK